jgi:holo-[acyl-carrier protein] synthase
VDIGVGTDIVAVERVAVLVRDRGEHFVQRWFTSDEIAYCQSKAQPALHLAGRLAAKEAVAKSLRSPWEGPPPWRDIEVTVDADGVPGVRLAGEVEQVASRLGIEVIRVSLSHCQEFAAATAVYLKP